MTRPRDPHTHDPLFEVRLYGSIADEAARAALVALPATPAAVLQRVLDELDIEDLRVRRDGSTFYALVRGRNDVEREASSRDGVAGAVLAVLQQIFAEQNVPDLPRGRPVR